MNADMRKKVVIAALALVFLVVIVGVATRKSENDRPFKPDKCKYARDNVPVARKKRVSSADSLAMVELEGYLRLQTGSYYVYLPLELTEVEMSEEDERNRRTVTISADCARIVMSLRRTPNEDPANDITHVFGIRVEYPSFGEEGVTLSSAIKKQLLAGMLLVESKSYVCPLKQYFDFVKDEGDQNSVSLVSLSLQLEFDKTPKQIATGQFGSVLSRCENKD